MRASVVTPFLAIASLTTAHLLPRVTDRDAYDEETDCGDFEPTADDILQSQALADMDDTIISNSVSGSDTKIKVNVYVHVVTADIDTSLSHEPIRAQIKSLNEAYNPFRIYFEHLETDYLVSKNWSQGHDHDAMKTYLRQGNYKDLNLYFVDRPRHNGRAVKGFCPFPKSSADKGSSDFELDGCIIKAETIDSEGTTAIHEIGHWFDLFHTFQGGCEGGDQVSDTPAQAHPSRSCAKPKNTCPGEPGVDPINNFMDYSTNECRQEFTEGQGARMRKAWRMFREKS